MVMREDTTLDEVSHYRHMYGYFKEFDITLAAAFEPEEKGASKFPFYNDIGRVVESFGKTIFLPHKEIDLDWEPRKIYDVANRIVIPSSDLVLCYSGLPSTAAGIMIEHAYHIGKTLVLLHDKNEGIREAATMVDFRGIIRFEDERQAIDMLKFYLERFYRIQQFYREHP